MGFGIGRDSGAVDIAAPAEIRALRGRYRLYCRRASHCHLLPMRIRAQFATRTAYVPRGRCKARCSHQLHNGSGSHRDRRRRCAGELLGDAPRGAGTDLIGRRRRVRGRGPKTRAQPARRHRALPPPARLSSRLGCRRGGRARGCLFDVVRSDDRHAPGTAAAEHFGFDGAEAWATARRQGHASRSLSLFVTYPGLRG